MKKLFFKFLTFVGLKPFSLKRVIFLCMPFVIVSMIIAYDFLISTFYILSLTKVVSSVQKIDFKLCKNENQYSCLKDKISEIPFHSNTGGLLFLVKTIDVIKKNNSTTNDIKTRDLVNLSLDIVEHTELKKSPLNNVFTFTPIGYSQLCLIKKMEQNLMEFSYVKNEMFINKSIGRFETKPNSNVDWNALRKRSQAVFNLARENNKKYLSPQEVKKCKIIIGLIDRLSQESPKEDKLAELMNESEN